MGDDDLFEVEELERAAEWRLPQGGRGSDGCHKPRGG
jgi:hypothetical protein